MNLNTIRFSCTTLVGTQKKGILTPDEDGYYTMPLGGLNVFNSAGQYYTYEGARGLFEASSAFMRRVKTGCLKGETGHPKMLPNQSMDSYVQRVMMIDEKNVSHHISEIWLDFDNIKDTAGKPMIGIMGKVGGSGPNGPALVKSLSNPKEEVCMSIRAFTDDSRFNGITQRALKEIVTFDWVVEPGISTAKKYYSPVLESFVDTQFTKEDIIKSMTTNDAIAMESVKNNGLQLFESLGWEFEKSDVPSWIKWK